ncbi:PhzF family phenazine biosynthesis protein [Enterococcus sp. 669A]|uniref:PhzF family phenazine biosynthesis protein n=1 Tax=Candidatus Enterococcus moelleringii TaxID=2815325 RepID=A0ABS3LGQ1_9ENTE|nr:PhzF family phenazine biosynthesis protein [Enterococcus sp. 669A]
MPDAGITEDPATGSANGNLAAYLLKYNYFGKNQLQYNLRQGIEINRPSLLHIEASLIKDTYEIYVGGNVHLVAKGEWA